MGFVSDSYSFSKIGFVSGFVFVQKKKLDSYPDSYPESRIRYGFVGIRVHFFLQNQWSKIHSFKRAFWLLLKADYKKTFTKDKYFSLLKINKLPSLLFPKFLSFFFQYPTKIFKPAAGWRNMICRFSCGFMVEISDLKFIMRRYFCA